MRSTSRRLLNGARLLCRAQVIGIRRGHGGRGSFAESITTWGILALHSVMQHRGWSQILPYEAIVRDAVG